MLECVLLSIFINFIKRSIIYKEISSKRAVDYKEIGNENLLSHQDTASRTMSLIWTSEIVNHSFNNKNTSENRIIITYRRHPRKIFQHHIFFHQYTHNNAYKQVSIHFVCNVYIIVIQYIKYSSYVNINTQLPLIYFLKCDITYKILNQNTWRDWIDLKNNKQMTSIHSNVHVICNSVSVRGRPHKFNVIIKLCHISQSSF